MINYRSPYFSDEHVKHPVHGSSQPSWLTDTFFLATCATKSLGQDFISNPVNHLEDHEWVWMRYGTAYHAPGMPGISDKSQPGSVANYSFGAGRFLLGPHIRYPLVISHSYGKSPSI